MRVKSKYRSIQDGLKLAPSTINDWSSFMREFYIDWAINNKHGKIGEVGKIDYNCKIIINIKHGLYMVTFEIKFNRDRFIKKSTRFSGGKIPLRK